MLLLENGLCYARRRSSKPLPRHYFHRTGHPIGRYPLHNSDVTKLQLSPLTWNYENYPLMLPPCCKKCSTDHIVITTSHLIFKKRNRPATLIILLIHPHTCLTLSLTCLQNLKALHQYYAHTLIFDLQSTLGFGEYTEASGFLSIGIKHIHRIVTFCIASNPRDTSLSITT